ncbi:hypothetical protein E3T48_08485 [Cryobacterium fucosi]|uniref:TadE family protein n=2 Tax=Cryobacterium fucosi TaxID=1259157 RepID=A0A4R9BAE1_9MICO|nr:hypothetical protein E3T48_08485 [Cryobacterium fucosi]
MRNARLRQAGTGFLAGEDGSAALEFITAGSILLVPLVYLVLAMSALQGGAFAVEGAARQAARVYVQAPDEAAARAAAIRAVQVGLDDYGIPGDRAAVTIDCGDGGCLARRSTVTVTVRIRVALPLVPDLLSLRSAASIPIEAVATQTVSRFRRAG